MKVISTNKKAFHDYFIYDKYEAGIVLVGSEVKSLRQGRINIKDSFVKFFKGEPFLMNAHISYLDTTNPYFKLDERRDRKLLLKKKEIGKLIGKISIEGYTIVPTIVYFNQKNDRIFMILQKQRTINIKKKISKNKQFFSVIPIDYDLVCVSVYS